VTPYRDDLLVTLTYAEIEFFNIWEFHKAAKWFQNTWCVAPVFNTPTRGNILCLRNRDQAQKLTDALATLIEGSGSTVAHSFGMSLLPIPERELRRRPDHNGMIVKTVERDSPPNLAGVEPSEILHSVNGVPCTSREIFADAMNRAEQGANNGFIVISVLRRGREMDFEVRYPDLHGNFSNSAELRSQFAAVELKPPPAPLAKSGGAPVAQRMGIQIRAITESDLTVYNLSKAHGILVVDVTRGELADKMGLAAGDVILEVNKRDVGDLDSFTQLARSGGIRRLKVWRLSQIVELEAPFSL
jgi:S1-C subfamily serine protease